MVIEIRKPEEVGLTMSSDEYQGLDLNATFDEMISGQQEIANRLMAGEIPEDVLQQIETVTAEQSLSRGLGLGSAARNLTARDLGLTSLSLMEKGTTMADQISRVVEAKREFNKENDLAIQKHLEVMRQTDLGIAALEEQRREFNASQTMRVNELITSLGMFGAELQFNYTATKLEGNSAYAAASLQDIAAIITDLRNLLG